MARQFANSPTPGDRGTATLRPKRLYGFVRPIRLLSRAFGAIALVFAAVAMQIPSASAQGTIVDCPDPESQNFIMPP